MSFVVRRALPDDVAGIAEVQIASWQGAYRGIIADATLDRLDIARHAIQWQRAMDKRAPIWVAAAEAAVIGFVSLRENEITVLYVRPDWQRRGAGRQLLKAAFAAVAETGTTLAWLWVLEANVAARAFYEAVGGRRADSGPVRLDGQDLVQVRYLWDLPC